jgi:hypothetical protein
MLYRSVEDFITRGQAALAKGPVALIFAEDDCLLPETVSHHLSLGFAQVVLLLPESLEAPRPADGLSVVTCDTHGQNAMAGAVTRLGAASPAASWLYWGYNAEFLFFPFCETRRIGEFLAFHTEERRSAVMCYVVDLYADDLDRFPDAVSMETAMFDRSGYFAAQRFRDGKPLTRQMDIFGGIRWRFEEHVPWARRRIDRAALFRPAKGLELRADLTFSDEEMNTVACPWHNNMTGAVASFRAARALRTNPGSKWAIPSFTWPGSAKFDWSSKQLLELGMMESGQWF